MSDFFKDPAHLAATADAMGRTCRDWQGSTQNYHFAVRDMVRDQAARITALEVRAEAAEAKLAEAVEAFHKIDEEHGKLHCSDYCQDTARAFLARLRDGEGE